MSGQGQKRRQPLIWNRRRNTSQRRYQGRSPVERMVALKVVGDLAVVRLQLRRHGYRVAVEQADAVAVRRSEVGDLPPRRLARIVLVVARLVPWRTNCLDRSLALARTLRRADLRPVVCLGVRRGEDGLGFHAWVELAGEVVNDDDRLVAQYRRFDGPPPAGAAIE